MKFRFIMAEVGKGLTRNRAMSVAVILTTFVSVLFVGLGLLAQLQVNNMKSEWYDKIEVSIYMCAVNDTDTDCQGTAATEEQIDKVRQRLASAELKPYISQVYEETTEQAYANFKEQYGDSEWGRWASPEVLPFSFRVKMVDPEQYQILNEEFTGVEGVAKVQDQRKIVEPLFKLIDTAKLLSLGLAAIMTLAAVLLISTTIRLSALSRERETSIMRLVGASSLFIQAPFMIEGAIAAVTGALLAVAALFTGVHVLVGQWLAPAAPLIRFVGVREVALISPLLVLAAAGFAVAASLFALMKYTKI